MTAHLSPFEAYSQDVGREPGRERFGADDGEWIALAHAAWRVGEDESTPPGAPLRRLADEMREIDPASASWLGRTLADAFGTADPVASFVTAGAKVAARMEDEGALLLAATLLGSLVRVGRDSAPLERGRLLAQWARVERQLGEFDIAADLYQDAGRLGKSARVPELRARAELGLGVLARIRGNYPEARTRFRRALAIAERAELATLTGLAHQALFVIAEVARDFDTALMHGWAALAHAAGDSAREVDVLVNLSILCLDAQQHRAALSTALVAAERSEGVRTRLPVLANAAIAAARLGETATFERCSAEVERDLGTGVRPYERAQLLHQLFLAFSAAGRDAEATRVREHGLSLSRAHGFAELVHEFESAVAITSVSEPALRTAGARRVVRTLENLAVAGAGRDEVTRAD